MSSVTDVIAYYSGRPDGAYERVGMFRIDYLAAVKKEPGNWSLTAPVGGIPVIDRENGCRAPTNPGESGQGIIIPRRGLRGSRRPMRRLCA
jgi:hypothetical protein